MPVMMIGRNVCQLYMREKVKEKKKILNYNSLFLYVSLALLVQYFSEGFKHLESF